MAGVTKNGMPKVGAVALFKRFQLREKALNKLGDHAMTDKDVEHLQLFGLTICQDMFGLWCIRPKSLREPAPSCQAASEPNWSRIPTRSQRGGSSTLASTGMSDRPEGRESVGYVPPWWETYMVGHNEERIFY